jgi:hypothetical protein
VQERRLHPVWWAIYQAPEGQWVGIQYRRDPDLHVLELGAPG